MSPVAYCAFVWVTKATVHTHTYTLPGKERERPSSHREAAVSTLTWGRPLHTHEKCWRHWAALFFPGSARLCNWECDRGRHRGWPWSLITTWQRGKKQDKCTSCEQTLEFGFFLSPCPSRWQINFETWFFFFAGFCKCGMCNKEGKKKNCLTYLTITIGKRGPVQTVRSPVFWLDWLVCTIAQLNQKLWRTNLTTMAFKLWRRVTFTLHALPYLSCLQKHKLYTHLTVHSCCKHLFRYAAVETNTSTTAFLHNSTSTVAVSRQSWVQPWAINSTEYRRENLELGKKS